MKKRGGSEEGDVVAIVCRCCCSVQVVVVAVVSIGESSQCSVAYDVSGVCCCCSVLLLLVFFCFCLVFFGVRWQCRGEVCVKVKVSSSSTASIE